MRTRMLTGGLALVASAALMPAVGAEAATVTCNGAFDAHVRSGPDADLSLVGDLRLSILDTGELRGRLVQGRGGERLRVATVRGTLSGDSIRLTFTTRHGKRLRGSGTVSDLRACSASLTGALRGPAAADRGVWGYAIGG